MSKKHVPNKNLPVIETGSWYTLNAFKARIIIIIACVVCYGNSVFNDFSLDDDFAYTQNAYVQKGIAGIPDILTHSYLSTAAKVGDYRPIVGITYAIEHQFFGNNAHVGHVINLLLFIIFCLIVFEVLSVILQLNALPSMAALLIILIYIAHPVHTEVVDSIKNRDEILSFTFSFLAVWYALKYFTSKDFGLTPAAYSLVFMLLAMFSKLTSLPMVAIILLTGLFTVPPAKKKTVYRFVAVIGSVALLSAILILFNLKRPNYFYENPLALSSDLSLRLGSALETLLFYFKFMLFPYPPRFYYGFNTLPIIPISDIQAVFSFILFGCMLVYGLISFSRRQLPGFFMLAYLLSIILYCNITTIYPGIVSERVLFAPSLWFISAGIVILYRVGGFGTAKNGGVRHIILTGGIIIGAVYSVLTIQRNFQWKNTLTLMSSDISHLQNSTLANYFYASLLQETGEKNSDTIRNYYLAKAKQYYKKSLAVSPDYSEPYFKLGMIDEYDENRNDSAFNCFKIAYRLDTTLTPVRFQLAKLYLFKGNFKEANPLFQHLYQEIPTDTFTLFFYAQSLFFDGDTVKAFKVNNQLLALAPQIYQPYLNRGMFNKFSGNMAAAEPDLQRSLQMGCTEPVVINSLLNYYTETGQTDKANALQKYQRRNP